MMSFPGRLAVGCLILVLTVVQALGQGAPEAKVVAAAPGAELPLTWQVTGEFVTPADGAGWAHRNPKLALELSADVGAVPGGWELLGEVRFPGAGANFRFEFAQQEVDGKAQSLTHTSNLGKDLRLVIGRDSYLPRDPAHGVWLPFRLRQTGRFAQAWLAGHSLAANTLAASSGKVKLRLAGLGEVRGLSARSLPAGWLPIHLGAMYNAKLEAPAPDQVGLGPLAELAPEALPAGWLQVDGVPFDLTPGPRGQVMDVAASMRGFTATRLKGSYLSSSSLGMHHRLVAQVPGSQYQALHLLAVSSERPAHLPELTVRMGRFGGSSGILDSIVVPVPGLAGGQNAMVQSRVPVKLRNGQMGWLYHLRVPLGMTANIAEFSNYDLEFTRGIKTFVPVPDPYEFGELPAGLPSSVVILGATLSESPVTMTASTREAGNVFHEGTPVAWQLALNNPGEQAATVTVKLAWQGPGTPEEFGVAKAPGELVQTVTLPPKTQQTVELLVPLKLRGWYEVRASLLQGATVLQARDTTMALLAPDTRKALSDSPFGVWCFWTAHSISRRPDNADKQAQLINKGGWRFTYGGSPAHRGDAPEEEVSQRESLTQKYKFQWTIQSPHQAYQRGDGWFDEKEFNEKLPAWLANAKANQTHPYYKVLHESRSSTSIVRRYSEFLGGTEYAMPDTEKAKLETQFARVRQYCQALVKLDPEAKIVLINDYPAVGIEYMKRGFPKDAFHAFGSEGAMFMRQPERQPDWLCLLGVLHTWKRAKEQYGYTQPVWFTEALYHGTSPGNLTLHDQGVIAVREAMLALALGVERMAAAGLLVDSADDYRWSNWGSAGFCFRDPEYNPKPSYAMYAWLTQVLDQAKYVGKLPGESPVLHILKFRRPDGALVQPVWVVRGRQDLRLRLAPGAVTIHDVYGNVLPVGPDAAGNYALTASDTPIYVVGAEVTAIEQWTPVEVPGMMPGTVGSLLVDFGVPEAYKVLTEPNPVLESNWDTPRIKGNYKVDFVKEAGGAGARFTLLPDDNPRKLLPRYVELALAKPLVISEPRPFALTARIHGHGGWGRIMFELVDAKGRIWTSCGNQSSGASNSSDTKGDSYISFSGWHTISMPLPGQYPGADQKIRWPRNFDWWPTNTPEKPAREAKFVVDTQAYEAAMVKYRADLAAHQEATAAHTAAMKAYEEARVAHVSASKVHAEAVAKARAAKQAAPPAPVAPVKPGAAPVAPVEPRKPGPPRDLGDELVDYPLTLTKVIVALQPAILFVDEERPLREPSILVERVGVLPPPPGW